MVPDTVTTQSVSNWSHYSNWVLAGGQYTSTITVTVTNTSGNAGDVWVHTWADDSRLGTVLSDNISVSIQNGHGFGVFVFVPSRISGDALIHIEITDPDTGISYERPEWQQTIRIDHNLPRYFKSISYPANVTVGTNATITVQLSDVFGNSVDGRRIQAAYSENITFLDSLDSDGTFWDGVSYSSHIHTYQTQMGETGFAEVHYQLPVRSGSNVIRISAPYGVTSNQTNSNYTWITLRGTPSTPVTLISTIWSNSTGTHEAIADGLDTFFINYSVYDQYNNPVPDVTILWSSDRGESKNFLTNYQGLIFLEFGPSTQIQNITLTAFNATTNPAVDILSFISEGPSIFTVYANPSNIASREANAQSMSYIRAKLTDNLGRPMAGKAITFIITGEATNPTGSLVEPSSFAAYGSTVMETTSLTDADGFAIAPFYPGMFPDENSSNFIPNAEGTASIRAAWTDDDGSVIEDSVEIQYKNYPYLRVETNINPPQISVGNTTTVQIRLTGDGYSPHHPVDVVLCDSRGESMVGDLYAFNNSKGISHDKEVWAQKAIWNFTYEFSERDRVGLVTFGIQGPTDLLMKSKSGLTPGEDNNESDDSIYIDTHYLPYPKTYTDYATVDIGLTRIDDNLRATIAALNVTPSKDSGGTNIVPVRYGLFTALQEVNQCGLSCSGKTVRAVVLLVDSEWSSWGNPLAGSNAEWSNPADCVKYSQGYSGQYCAFPELGGLYDANQNLATYAKSKNTLIFVIVLPKKGGSINNKVMDAYTTLATSTGGDLYIANSADDLFKWYYDIALKLKIYASVDTRMNLSLQNVNVTYQDVTRFEPGSTLFDYEYEEAVSTNVSSWNQTGTITDRLRVPPYPADAIPGPFNGNITYPYSLDQTDEWSLNELRFYVGNITIGQTWQAEFRLKALEPGLISLFGPGSEGICYSSEDGSQNCIPIPMAIVTATQNITNETRDQNLLDIIDGSIDAKPVPSTDLVHVTWDLNYTGDLPVLQYIYYQYSRDSSIWDGNWIRFATNYTGGQPLDHAANHMIMDVRELIGSTNGYIKFRVTAQEIAFGGASDEEESGEFMLGNLDAKIRIT